MESLHGDMYRTRTGHVKIFVLFLHLHAAQDGEIQVLSPKQKQYKLCNVTDSGTGSIKIYLCSWAASPDHGKALLAGEEGGSRDGCHRLLGRVDQVRIHLAAKRSINLCFEMHLAAKRSNKQNTDGSTWQSKGALNKTVARIHLAVKINFKKKEFIG